MKKLFISILALGVAGIATASVKDSIGQKVVNGKNYILYKVEAKETLYSLSKKYKTTVDAITMANDGLSAGLKKGSTIMIPSAAKVSTLTQTTGVQALHVVGDGETLYSISKKYKISVENLKTWNSLSGNEISKGQELKVSKPSGVKVSNNKVLVDLSKDLQDKTVITTDPNAQINSKPDIGFDQVEPPKLNELDPVKKEEYSIDTSLYGEEVTESKSFSKISSLGIDQSKNLAQMKGVKVGTILMLVNPANNKATFVRVISGESDEGINVTNSVLSALNLTSMSETKIKVSYTK